MKETTHNAPGNLRELTGTVSAIQSAAGATKEVLHNLELEQNRAGVVLKADLQEFKLQMARDRAADHVLFMRGQA